MADAARILYGAVFTAAVCWAAGRLLLDRLRIGFHRFEEQLFAFLAGSAAVSLAVFFLCLGGAARRGVFQWAGGAVILWAVWREWRRPRSKSLPKLPTAWLAVFLLVFGAFFFHYFFHALAPEVSPDGAGYHLGNVGRFAKARGFVWDHHGMYSYLSQGLEMLFLIAYTLGRHSAAAMVHLVFLAVLPWLVVCFGLRTGYARAGVFAGAAIYVSPVVGMDGSIAYNDVALAAILFAIVYSLHVWVEQKSLNLLILSGILIGFAYGVKYTSVTVVLLALGWVIIARRGSVFSLWRSCGTLAGGASVLALPWILRNWIWLGNPFAPFFNRWFPNPYYHRGMEEIYRSGLQRYEGIEHAWQIPLHLTIWGGGNVTGMLGPVFLLAPLALLALRNPLGRRMLLAAGLFAVPAIFNVGSRFLIPSLPFLAMAMGIAMQNSPGVLPALGVFHAVLCWPALLPKYCQPYAWRLPAAPPIDAALRRIPEKDYIERHSGDLGLKAQIEHVVPPRGRIFSFAGRPESYIDREILVSYQSSEANLFNDILLAPIDGFKPTMQRRWRWTARPLQAVRVVQEASGPAFWSVAELRVSSGGRDLWRQENWRLQARPNGWEVQLAFDNSPVTRWQSWEATRPGQFIELRFGKPETIDSLLIESSGEHHSRLRLEGQGSDGRWAALGKEPELVEVPPPRGMRLAAARELKARGIRFLLLQDTDFFGEDVAKHAQYWGITRLGAAGGAQLYRID